MVHYGWSKCTVLAAGRGRATSGQEKQQFLRSNGGRPQSAAQVCPAGLVQLLQERSGPMFVVRPRGCAVAALSIICIVSHSTSSTGSSALVHWQPESSARSLPAIHCIGPALDPYPDSSPIGSNSATQQQWQQQHPTGSYEKLSLAPKQCQTGKTRTANRLQLPSASTIRLHSVRHRNARGLLLPGACIVWADWEDARPDGQLEWMRQARSLHCPVV